ncbi:MAG: hypothetical protein IJ430_04950 [Parabacteroides sp.]|nr:hypothetical protein [Parabacteroides sp.]
MRKYINLTTENDSTVKRLMEVLSSSTTSVDEYRNAFYQIGVALGNLLNQKVRHGYGKTMLACAAEDVDWLVKGVLESISQKEIALAVFWHGRITLDEEMKLEYSPILKSYVEPIDNCQTLILVKSIISTSCVVKTQLTRLVNKINPSTIYILSPVLYKDAESNLQREFPKRIYDKFKFLTFAIDSERDEQGAVLPGIGGMVYPKLGLGDSQEKNKYIPNLVKERI